MDGSGYKIAGILYVKNLRPGEEVKQLTTEGHTASQLLDQNRSPSILTSNIASRQIMLMSSELENRPTSNANVDSCNEPELQESPP